MVESMSVRSVPFGTMSRKVNSANTAPMVVLNFVIWQIVTNTCQSPFACCLMARIFCGPLKGWNTVAPAAVVSPETVEYRLRLVPDRLLARARTQLLSVVSWSKNTGRSASPKPVPEVRLAVRPVRFAESAVWMSLYGSLAPAPSFTSARRPPPAEVRPAPVARMPETVVSVPFIGTPGS